MNNEFISSIEEIIEDQKLGKMVIMVDDEDRENEGDLIIPAAKVDDKAINFMATHGRGLICLSLTEDRVKELDLPLMSQNNDSRDTTAFTISIEAKESFMENGGEKFETVPCLNHNKEHIDLLEYLVLKYLIKR